MGEKQSIEKLILELKEQFLNSSIIKDELWKYHPSNPNFINPIKAFEDCKIELEDISHRINDLEFKLNSLN
jgi:hypothetical protein